MKKTLPLLMVLILTVGTLPGIASDKAGELGKALMAEAERLWKNARNWEEREKAIEKAHEALKFYSLYKEYDHRPTTLTKIADWLARNGEFDKAMTYMARAVAICEETGDWKHQAQLLGRTASIGDDFGRGRLKRKFYGKAVAFCRKRAALELKRGNSKDAAWCYNKMANFQRSMSQYDKALECNASALTIYRKLGEVEEEADTHTEMAWDYKSLGKLQEALRSNRQALRAYRKLGEAWPTRRALLAVGESCLRVGRMQQARRSFSQAVRLFREDRDPKAEPEGLMEVAEAYSLQGHCKMARKFYEKALAIFRKMGDLDYPAHVPWLMSHECSDCIGVLEQQELLEKSLELYRREGNYRWQRNVLNSLAWLFANMGQYEKAFEYMEKCVEIDTKLGDANRQRHLSTIGCFHHKLGQYGKALKYYEKQMEVYKRGVYPAEAADSVRYVGRIYQDWGRYEKALYIYETSLEMSRKLGHVIFEGHALDAIASVYASWGQYKKALEIYEQHWALDKEYGGSIHFRLMGERSYLKETGKVYAAMGNYQQALTNFRKALDINTRIKGSKGPELTDFIGDAYLALGELKKAEPFVTKSPEDLSRARLYLLKRDYANAETYYEKAMSFAQKSSDVSKLFTTYTGLGLASEGTGDNLKAEKNYRKAVALTEELRSSLPKAQREKFLDVRIHGLYRIAPYEGLARVLIKTDRSVEAFKVSEYSKARAFAEAVSRFSAETLYAVPAEVLTMDEELHDQLAALKKKKQEAREKGDKPLLTALKPRIAGLENQLGTHIRMLRDKYPFFAVTKYPEPMDLAQTALKDEEWLISYDVTDPGIIIYLTRGKKLVKALFKEVPRNDLDKLVRVFREPLELGPGDKLMKKLAEFDLVSGKKLADILLGDLLPDLPEKTPVIIVPDDLLGVIPFEMLVLNDGGAVKTDSKIPYVSGAQFFGDRNPISYTQSITALTLARTLGRKRKAAKKCLVLDDPVFTADDPRVKRMAQKKKKILLASLPDKLMSIKNEIGLSFPRLPLTGELGKCLKEIDPNKTDEYSGMKAAKPVLFKSPLETYGSMVFATHGYFGKDLPGIQEPVLVLTLVGQPEGKDGFLRMSEVMGLKMNADIVALTACQTGLGRRITGEGTMGMGRAFQYAGAKSVLMSLWSVAEDSSVKLVESFFKHLKEGKSKLDALQLARKEIREAGYDHPFYWAPFILVGEVN